MGIITKTVKMRVNAYNIKYYEEKGYDIPKKPATYIVKHKSGRDWMYDKDAYFDVKIEDLNPNSNYKVEVECDICHQIKEITYSVYLNCFKNGDFYACKHCQGVKNSKSLLERYSNEELKQQANEKRIQTFQKRYNGATCAMDVDEFKEKAQLSTLSHFGVLHPNQNKEILNKVQQTCFEHFGNIFYFKSDDWLNKRDFIITEEIKEKWANSFKQSFFKKYGVYNPSQVSEIQEKKLNTLEQHFGERNWRKIPEINNKIIETNNRIYGGNTCMSSPKIRKKASETLTKNGTVNTSKQQLYLWNLYGGELNGVIGHYNCDIVLRDENIYIEFQGGGHFLSVKMGNKTQEEFNQKEIVRNNIIKREGYKRIEITSRKDKLPSDEVLLDMLSYARTFFLENPQRSWLNFDIDNSCIYNAYHKEDGEPYDYGPLRSIKKKDVEIAS